MPTSCYVLCRHVHSMYTMYVDDSRAQNASKAVSRVSLAGRDPLSLGKLLDARDSHHGHPLQPPALCTLSAKCKQWPLTSRQSPERRQSSRPGLPPFSP